MTSQEMMKADLPKGMCWSNISKLGETPDWRAVPNPHGPNSDPNYGFGMLFGYAKNEFLAKQYR